MLSLSLAGQYQIETAEQFREEIQAILADTNNREASKIALALNKAGFWQHQFEDQLLISGPKLKLGSIEIDGTQTEGSRLVLNEDNWNLSLDQILQGYAEKGYPFAQLVVQSLRVEENRVYPKATINSGPFIPFDSLVVLGYTEINRPLLYYESNWNAGRPFSERYLRDLEENIQASEYLNTSKAPAVAFFPDGAQVYLYLTKRSANQISGIIGLNTESEGETTLNGDFELKLLNTFNRGESLNIRWRSPDRSVQDFQFDFAYPYLYGSPFGLSSGFSLFRQDSSFIKRNFKLGFSYRLANQSFFTVNGFIRSSDPLGINENNGQSFGSFQQAGAGIGLKIIRLNQRIVARKGYLLELDLKSAQREANQEISLQYAWSAEAAYYANFTGNWVWHQSLGSQGIGGSQLFENELDRLGGIKTLRGFNELQLFTSSYALSRNELRYMLGPLDYLSIFLDAAYTENRSRSPILQNWHTGMGAGINFQTKGGIFSLFLAVGQSASERYDFRATKVHLSYVNSF